MRGSYMGILKSIANFFDSKEEVNYMAQLGRNDICWCGSGKKYKKCHLAADEKKFSKKNAQCGSA
jgi:hypothetical protein